MEIISAFWWPRRTFESSIEGRGVRASPLVVEQMIIKLILLFVIVILFIWRRRRAAARA